MKLSFIAAALASAIALCEGSTKMVIGYFPNWLYANYPVENIPYNKYTHINYAFAILNNPDNLPSFSDDWAVESGLPKIVQLAHKNKTKVLLSIGGWTGSKRFSPMVATAESRKKFIDWNIEFIEKYNTDGVDIDWEYPGRQAAGCNEFADNDADNFLLLLKELRSALDAKFPNDHKEVSMAVHVQPFIKSGVPMSDLKAYVPYFDHVNLMTYDINGAWAPVTGPNAPFRYEPGKGSPFSFVDSIKQWKAAGVPSEKITAGLPFYGRAIKANVNMHATQPLNQYQPAQVGAPKGDSDDAYWDDPYCNVEPGGLSGIWKWTNLRKEGLIKDDFVSTGAGWTRHWDDVSQTPWLFNPSSQIYITYDDPQSLSIKVQHAMCEDLAGVMVWDIHQDNGELLDVVNKVHEPVDRATCQSHLTAPKSGNPLFTPAASSASTPSPTSVAAASPEQSEDEYGDLDNWTVETNPEIATPVATASISTKATPAQETLTIQTIDSPSMTAVSTAPSQAVPTSLGSLSGGQSCSVPGQQKCVHSGHSPTWVTCNFGQWLERECSAGLVCVDDQGALYCDFPSNKPLHHVAKADTINNNVVSSKVVSKVSSKPVSISSAARTTVLKSPSSASVLASTSASARPSTRPMPKGTRKKGPFVKNNHKYSLAVERPNDEAAHA
ncbi:hypothetical protein G6F70_001222 [Rhizopus microsporus]|nr:hypothetical protein G6F71_002190 [Rhizopus microsporus]KAG1203632.1 hypothetical protein G6F70_001222 [Rhizopus microsporus]KAG1213924.1 hypothetical protein G6F69_002371 [Rhizopus microsporus]KAG1232358.1 hypothetical protein G6F67_005072 [Rhizopus microsporus]KAG1264520.1 hypothetical protein G6F68_004285 [Rhizopus microsporus]